MSYISFNYTDGCVSSSYWDNSLLLIYIISHSPIIKEKNYAKVIALKLEEIEIALKLEDSSRKKCISVIWSFLNKLVGEGAFGFRVYLWFLISSVVYPGFQNQVDSFPIRSLSSTCTGFIRFISGVTPADILAFL